MRFLLHDTAFIRLMKESSRFFLISVQKPPFCEAVGCRFPNRTDSGGWVLKIDSQLKEEDSAQRMSNGPRLLIYRIVSPEFEDVDTLKSRDIISKG